MKKEPRACRHCTLAHYELSPMCRGKHAENCPQRKTRWALLGLGGIAFATVAIFAGTKLSVSAADTENKTLSAPTQRADTVAVAKVMDPRVRD